MISRGLTKKNPLLSLKKSDVNIKLSDKKRALPKRKADKYLLTHEI